jgi:hypothetical protein
MDVVERCAKELGYDVVKPKQKEVITHGVLTYRVRQIALLFHLTKGF